MGHYDVINRPAPVFQLEYSFPMYRVRLEPRHPGEPIMDLVSFVGGVHVAGKGVFTAELGRRLSLLHLSAGELITKQLRRRDTGKEVNDIEENQHVLLAALRARCREGETVLLDGHFAVLTRNGTPQEIPLWVFRALQPKSLLLLMADPKESYDRIVQRDGCSPSIHQLGALQVAEIRAACAIADNLRIPLLVLDASKLDLATVFLQHTLGGR